jgi:methylisocitrate lyase
MANRMTPAQRFRDLLARGGILQIPGAHNGMAALQARAAGFEAVYLSGAAMSASMGLPDIGLITVQDVCFFVRQVARPGLPVLVDADTGFGGPLQVMQAVRALQDAGAAALHIEDQLPAKKCGHLDGKRLVAAGEMAARIAAARRAAGDLVVIARTDAVAVEGLEAAIARARTYLEAGADAIFPEALTSVAMLRAFAEALPDTPLLANMTEFGRTPHLTANEFEALGYAMVIWPVSTLRVANKAQERLYAAIRRDGEARALIPDMQTRDELYALLDLAGWEALESDLAQAGEALAAR